MDPVLVGKVISIVLIANVILSGLSVMLSKVAEMTQTPVDDKAAISVAKIAGMLQKLVDLVSANNKH